MTSESEALLLVISAQPYEVSALPYLVVGREGQTRNSFTTGQPYLEVRARNMSEWTPMSDNCLYSLIRCSGDHNQRHSGSLLTYHPDFYHATMSLVET